MRVVLCTCPPDKASELAERLVGERLAACVNVVPGLTSVYWWEGKVQKGGESLLILKTPALRVEALKARLLQLHPYSVPEFLAFEVAERHGPYADWVRREANAP